MWYDGVEGYLEYGHNILEYDDELEFDDDVDEFERD